MLRNLNNENDSLPAPNKRSNPRIKEISAVFPRKYKFRTQSKNKLS